MAIQLSNDQIASIKKALHKHMPDIEYRLFGSRAKGTAKPYSDVDIILISSTPISLLSLSALEEDFADSDLPFKVDLVDWQRITPEFQQKIQSEWQAF